MNEVVKAVEVVREALKDQRLRVDVRMPDGLPGDALSYAAARHAALYAPPHHIEDAWHAVRAGLSEPLCSPEEEAKLVLAHVAMAAMHSMRALVGCVVVIASAREELPHA